MIKKFKVFDLRVPRQAGKHIAENSCKLNNLNLEL